jgi:hypothetical protein
MADDATFFKGMKLTQAEISILDRYVGIIEQAQKNRVDFYRSGTVAFTPGAMLVIAVAKFVYDVYQDYGSIAITPEDIQRQFKSIAKELAELESRGTDAPSADIYARFRQELLATKKPK